MAVKRFTSAVKRFSHFFCVQAPGRMNSKSKHTISGINICLAAGWLLLAMTAARAEDGYRLWMRYDPLPAETIAGYRSRVTSIVAPGNSATLDAIRAEPTTHTARHRRSASLRAWTT
jgi:hypothetical protein